jgi:hypothetical protein
MEHYLRVGLHTSQGPWSRNREGPWLSSKGHTNCLTNTVCQNLHHACLPLGSRSDGNFDKPWKIIHNLPCNNARRFFFGPLGLLLLVWSELEWFGLFTQKKIFKWNGHMPSISCTKWPLLGVSPMKVSLMQIPTDRETLSIVYHVTIHVNLLWALRRSPFGVK